MKTSQITLAHEGAAIDCYLAAPAGGGKAPGLLMASSVFGVTEDLTEICGVFAKKGFLAAAPDLFREGDKGPLPRTEEGQKRAMGRTANRPQALRGATIALKAALDHVRNHPSCNGSTAILGFCFGGPFAVAGVAELGCDAGAAFHGSAFDEQLQNLARTRHPLEFHWGDDDFALSPELLAQVRAACAANPNCNIVIYPGIRHGYTARTSQAYDGAARDNSWTLTLRMLDRLRA